MEVIFNMQRIGIVGHGSNKFTDKQQKTARNLIADILLKHHPNCILISGHSPVGGIDIWAEEIATDIGIEMEIKTPKQNQWDTEYGYKQRNLDIARCSDEIHVILVKDYPPNYKGMKFDTCYHCAKHKEANIPKHVKSGGCWTGWKGKEMGKELVFHIISAPLRGALKERE
jgi:hypothetical protein